jgi:hypothetical protein
MRLTRETWLTILPRGAKEPPHRSPILRARGFALSNEVMWSFLADRFRDRIVCMRWMLILALATALAPAAGCRRAPPFSGDWRALHHGERDGRWGFVDGSGRWAIEPRFVQYGEFSEGLAWAAEKGSAYGYIDKTGSWAIRPRFRHATEFSEGLAAVEDRSGRWGYVRPDGSWAIAPRFGSAQPFHEGRAAAEDGEGYRGPWGYIDVGGAWVVPPRYRHSPGFLYGRSAFERGIAVVDLGDGSTNQLIDRDGRVLRTLSSTWLRRGDGLLLERVGHSDECGRAGGDVWAYLDERGESAFDGRFCGAREFSDGLAMAWKDGRYGFIDKSGAWAIPPRYEVAGDFSEGLANVKPDGHQRCWQYVGKTGRVVIPCAGDGRAQKFEHGLAAIDVDSPNGYLAAGAKWGWMDRSGRVVAVFTRARAY